MPRLQLVKTTFHSKECNNGPISGQELYNIGLVLCLYLVKVHVKVVTRVLGNIFYKNINKAENASWKKNSKNCFPPFCVPESCFLLKRMRAIFFFLFFRG